MSRCPNSSQMGYTLDLFTLRLLVALRLSVFSVDGRPSRTRERLKGIADMVHKVYLLSNLIVGGF